MQRFACDAFERLSEAESVERRCSHGVQLTMSVVGAAEHVAEAWEAAVSVTHCLLQLCHLTDASVDHISYYVVRLSHRSATLARASLRLCERQATVQPWCAARNGRADCS